MTVSGNRVIQDNFSTAEMHDSSPMELTPLRDRNPTVSQQKTSSSITSHVAPILLENIFKENINPPHESPTTNFQTNQPQPGGPIFRARINPLFFPNPPQQLNPNHVTTRNSPLGNQHNPAQNSLTLNVEAYFKPTFEIPVKQEEKKSKTPFFPSTVVMVEEIPQVSICASDLSPLIQIISPNIKNDAFNFLSSKLARKISFFLSSGRMDPHNPFSHEEIKSVKQPDDTWSQIYFLIIQTRFSMWIQYAKNSKEKIVIDLFPENPPRLLKKGSYKEVYLGHRFIISPHNASRSEHLDSVIVRAKESIDLIIKGMTTHHKAYTEGKNVKFLAHPHEILDRKENSLVATTQKYLHDLSRLIDQPELVKNHSSIDFLAMLQQLSQAHKDLHESNIVHNDSYERNILVENGQIFLHDFDLATLSLEKTPELKGYCFPSNRRVSDKISFTYGISTPFTDCFSLFRTCDELFFGRQIINAFMDQTDFLESQENLTKLFDNIINKKLKTIIEKDFFPKNPIKKVNILCQNRKLYIDNPQCIDSTIQQELSQLILMHQKLFDLLWEVSLYDNVLLNLFTKKFVETANTAFKAENSSIDLSNTENVKTFKNDIIEQENQLYNKLEQILKEFQTFNSSKIFDYIHI